MFAVLIRNEFIKMFKRFAFWITYLTFAGIMVISYGESYWSARKNPKQSFELPGAWGDILGGEIFITLVFGSIILILLLSSEFSWRTARQNVIDGLSKDQFFVAKLLLIPIIVALFAGTQILIGGLLALAGTDLSAVRGPLIQGVHLSMFGGFVISFVGYGSLALFFSFAIRNSGPAMAVWFFYIVLLEGFFRQILISISDGLKPVVRFFPVSTFNQFFSRLQHDPEAFQQAVARAAQRGGGRPPPEIWDMNVLWFAAIGWITVLLVSSFLWFRKRDI